MADQAITIFGRGAEPLSRLESTTMAKFSEAVKSFFHQRVPESEANAAQSPKPLIRAQSTRLAEHGEVAHVPVQEELACASE